MSTRYARFALWAGLGLLGCDPGGFQPLSEGGNITGTLVDEAGRPRAEVPVYLVQDGRAVAVEKTQADGRFVLPFEDEGPVAVVLNDGRGYGAVVSTLPRFTGVDVGRLTSQRLLTAFPKIVEWTGVGFDERLTSGPGAMLPAFVGNPHFWLREDQGRLRELVEWKSDGTVAIVKSDVRGRAHFHTPWLYAQGSPPDLFLWRRVSDDAVLLQEDLNFVGPSPKIIARGENWVVVILYENGEMDEETQQPSRFDVVFARLSSDGSLRKSPAIPVPNAQYPCLTTLLDGRIAYQLSEEGQCLPPWMVIDPDHIEASFQPLEVPHLAEPDVPMNAMLRNTPSENGWWNVVPTARGIEIVRWAEGGWVSENRMFCPRCNSTGSRETVEEKDWGVNVAGGEYAAYVISRDPLFVRFLPKIEEDELLSTLPSTTGIWMDDDHMLGVFAVWDREARHFKEKTRLWMVSRDGQEKIVDLPFELCSRRVFQSLAVHNGYAYVRVLTDEDGCRWGRVSWDAPADLQIVSWVDGVDWRDNVSLTNRATVLNRAEMTALSEDGQWFLQAAIDPVHGGIELFRTRLPGGAP